MKLSKRSINRGLSLILTLSMLFGMMVTGVSATASSDDTLGVYPQSENGVEPVSNTSGAKLIFEYPDDVPEEDVKLSVFKGIPQWRQKNSAATVEDVPEALTNPTNPNFPKLEELKADADGSYTVTEAGGYCYFVRGKQPSEYYNILKLFIVSEEDLTAGSKTVAIKTGPSAGTGFESGNNNPVGSDGETAPDGFNQGVQHLVPIEGTDEMEHLLGTDDLVGYEPFTTPAFSEDRAMYQATTQAEMMQFIEEYASTCGYMHVYSMGTTSNYNYDYPLIVFTKKEIPADSTMEDAAQILQDGGLPIVWQQAQIHPYEPAAGESALVMIQELCGDYGEDILDSIDVVMIPRVNVEGGFLFWRGDYDGTDMNRDHMAVSTEQIAMLHDAYYTFMPHVVIDNHEFFFSEMGNYQNDPEKFKLNDFQITGATSLNDDPVITDLTTNVIVDKMHKDLEDTGFRPYHYGITSNNPIGRAYYGLTNAISVLIESHGADGALFAFPRRVYGQVVATKSVYEGTAENAEAIVAAVKNAREDVAEKGRTYEEDDILVLKQSASGAVTSPTPLNEYVADIYGNIESIGEKAISLQDTVVRSRPRPTAYVVDASEPFVSDMLYILDHHNAEYYTVPAGSTVELQQYYYIQKDGSKSCIADLRGLEEVTFENGAIVIPMDQESGNVIGMLMEPDVGDSSSYNGTLFQYGLIGYDESTMNMPLYRYIGDDPRTALGLEVDEDERLTHRELDQLLAGLGVTDYTHHESGQYITQQEAAAALFAYAGMKDSQLGEYPRDYNFMAQSVGLTDGFAYEPESSCTSEIFDQMLENAAVLYDALHADVIEPLFVDGLAQPIFDFDEALRFCVYVESNYDTDGDGKLDLIKALVQLPSEVLDEDGGTVSQVSTIFEARPYVTGTLNKVGIQYGEDGYDIESMYSQPAARTPAGSSTTAEAAANAVESDYYYDTPYDSDPTAYEDLNWYDYYLTRGFAIVCCGGPGTKGSEGFETCGTDLEIDAFKCVIEWLHGDRVAYTDLTSNITIEADWSTGKVGMTGKSYGGTTQFGLATTGVEGLETIVPVAGIASWYEYTNSQGLFTRSTANYVETLSWYCNGRYYDPDDYATIAQKYQNYLGQVRDDQLATNGDYGEPWQVRDYTLDWENIQCPALIVHGLNDTNVRTKQFEMMYQAYQKAGVDAKLLLHQSNHIVPTYPGHKTEMYIDDVLYDEVLNRWFSYYLYDVDNGADEMSTVTVQSNVDGSWDYYDSWETAYDMVMECGDYTNKWTTTISSDVTANEGITVGRGGNWERYFATGATGSSAFYAQEITSDVTIQGTVEVHITASNDARDRDPIWMSAMLVDIGDENFMAYTQSSLGKDTHLVDGGAWMGGGLENFDLVELTQEEVSYKVIANGWMDMCNPGAGYDSYTAAESITPVPGQYYDYVMYLQPNVYTVKAGHTLALVIFTYDPSKYTMTGENYSITIDNSETYAVIPVHEAVPGVTDDGGQGGSGSTSASYAIVVEDADNGSVKSSLSRAVKGATVVLTVKPDEGYELDELVVTDSKGNELKLTDRGDGKYAFTMPAAKVTVEAFFTKTAAEPGQPTAPAMSFVDVSGKDWFYNAVSYAYENGLMSGTSATTFAPNDKLTRAMVAQVIYNLEGTPAVSGTQFTDVAAGMWYTNAITWAAQNGLVSGYGDGKFGPNDLVTREQLAVILNHYAQFKKMTATATGSLAAFTDGATASGWAVNALIWAVDNGVMAGKGNSTLDPKGTATRAEVAQMFMNFLEG